MTLSRLAAATRIAAVLSLLCATSAARATDPRWYALQAAKNGPENKLTYKSHGLTVKKFSAQKVPLLQETRIFGEMSHRLKMKGDDKIHYSFIYRNRVLSESGITVNYRKGVTLYVKDGDVLSRLTSGNIGWGDKPGTWESAARELIAYIGTNMPADLKDAGPDPRTAKRTRR